MGGNALRTYMVMRQGDDRNGNDVESRFRDRKGRDHYDNGRFAPMRSAYDDGGVEHRSYPTHMPRVDREYDRPVMGYVDPVRMGDDEDYRRKWTITENNGGSPQYRGERNSDGMTRIYGFGGSHVEHPRMDEMEHRHGEKYSGHASGKTLPPFNREMAEDWMDDLQNADGSFGPHWRMEDIRTMMQQKGVQADPMKLWVGMNAEYSDMCAVARKHGIDKPEFYLDSAMARWINDKDAVDDKLSAYYMHVVKH